MRIRSGVAALVVVLAGLVAGSGTAGAGTSGTPYCGIVGAARNAPPGR